MEQDSSHYPSNQIIENAIEKAIHENAIKIFDKIEKRENAGINVNINLNSGLPHADQANMDTTQDHDPIDGNGG